MGHVPFEEMICESENATADTVGIVIEYCDSSIFQVEYDPVRKKSLSNWSSTTISHKTGILPSKKQKRVTTEASM